MPVLSHLILPAVPPHRGTDAHFTDGKAGKLNEAVKQVMGLKPICPGGGVQMLCPWGKFRGIGQVGPGEGMTLV